MESATITRCTPAPSAKPSPRSTPRDNFGDRYIYEYNTGTVYPYGTPGRDAYTLDYYRRNPATIPPAQDVSDLARLDIDLLRTVREAIDTSESQYAPAARERIDAILATR